jgi:predicted transposase YbfD/YdcC
MDMSIQHLFADLEDVRQAHKVRHNLHDIILLAIFAVISNAQSWTEIEAFGEAKQAWLQQYIGLENGIPAHDTIQRVFQSLNPDDLMKRFVTWTQQVMEATEGRFIAIDGKSMRRSYDQHSQQPALHLVRAWATEQGLILGHKRVEDKSNEITAIPDVLNLLALKGCMVTIDAMGCQTDIASQIQQQEGDYVLALKENQRTLYRHAVDWFDHATATDFHFIPHHDYARTINKGHGRVEIRECWLISDTPVIAEFREQQGWTGLHTLVKIRRQREMNGIRSEEVSYYISSLQTGAADILQAVRRHWVIENECHWVLDVIFDEDRSRIRLGDSPENFAILRHIALSILKQDQSKGSLKGKRFKAALNDDFRLQLLQNLHASALTI